MKKIFNHFLGLTTVLLILLTACSTKDESPTEPPPTTNTTLSKDQITGSLTVVDQSTLQPQDLKVVTFADESPVNSDGSFSVQSSEAIKSQVVFICSKNTENPIYLGIREPSLNTVEIDVNSTALALTLYNPYLIFTTEIERRTYLDAVEQNSKFEQLISVLSTAYTTDAEHSLDYDTNPTVYQLAAQLMKESMVSLGGAYKQAVSVGDPPYIEEAQGSDITLVNPRHVWYVAGIYPDDGNLKEVVTVPKDQFMSMVIDWPPQITTVPTEKNYALGNGSYKIYLTKKFDYSKFSNLNDPVGMATICNTAQTIMYMVELFIGNMDFFNELLIKLLPWYFNISDTQSYELEQAINSGDAGEFIIAFTEVLLANINDLSYWLWQESPSNAAKVFLENSLQIFRDVSVALNLLGYTNDQAPFFFDLLFAPGDVTYFINQENGSFITEEQNNAPQPAFSIDPPAGIIGTIFSFDASESTDDFDESAELSFRWDWKSNGTWDVGWSHDSIATHEYSESGAYIVTLEVKDTGGLSDFITHSVNIGGGRGTASHIKLFRDNLPWDSNATVEVLESLGFVVGTGFDTYEIISSDQMSVVSLIPGEDLVIICNDQNQTFYNNYATSQIRFTTFVNSGGSMLWEACDEGWANGSISSAGIELPGGITTIFDYDDYNYVVTPDLPLVAGLPQYMDHNYASHESFGNIPDGTTIYTINENDEPTLIEFNIGQGWIILTGQPLEHQYDNIYNQSDMEHLLPRIVSYFTGKSLEEVVAKRTLHPSEKPSSSDAR